MLLQSTIGGTTYETAPTRLADAARPAPGLAGDRQRHEGHEVRAGRPDPHHHSSLDGDRIVHSKAWRREHAGGLAGPGHTIGDERLLPGHRPGVMEHRSDGTDNAHMQPAERRDIPGTVHKLVGQRDNGHADLDALAATEDPTVWIEEERPGYIRYHSSSRRWEVWGTCPRQGSCQIGAAPHDAGWRPRSERLDIPVTPELICDPCTTVPLLRFVELEA